MKPELVAIKEAAKEMLDYAQEVRNDWSDFDGRSLLQITRHQMNIILKAVAGLERQLVESENE